MKEAEPLNLPKKIHIMECKWTHKFRNDQIYNTTSKHFQLVLQQFSFMYVLSDYFHHLTQLTLDFGEFIYLDYRRQSYKKILSNKPN